MPGLDTNALVRWLVEDDEKQTARAQRLFESARAGQTTLFVPSSVVLEFERVLRSRYQFDKATVLVTASVTHVRTVADAVLVTNGTFPDAGSDEANEQLVIDATTGHVQRLQLPEKSATGSPRPHAPAPTAGS